MSNRRSKHEEKLSRSLLKELPYFSYRGYLPLYHGRFNNLLQTNLKTKRNLENLPSLYDLDLFRLNTACDENSIANDNVLNQRIFSQYHSPYSFQKLKDSITVDTDARFSIFHNNIVSLKKNLEHLQTHILHEMNFHFDIIGITETKITTSNQNDPVPKIPGYEFEFAPTPLSFGGVGMFIDESLDYSVLEKNSNEAFQALWIEINFSHTKNLICGIVYRQHNSPELFQSYLEQTLERFESTGKNICLLGDFNICLMKSETSELSQNFMLSLQSCYLIPTIDKPTRVRNDSASLIDNIFVNSPTDVLSSGNIITDTSDHFSQFCIMKSKKEKSKPKKIKIRNFSNFSTDSFINDLNQINWNKIVSDGKDNIDKVFSTFYNRFNTIVNRHAPIKPLSRRQVKRFSKPWITPGIRSSIKIKNSLFANGDESKYKYYRNKIRNLIRISKRRYYHDYFMNNLSSMKKTWAGINAVLNRNAKKNKQPAALKDENGTLHKDPSVIANLLNNHFATIGQRLANKITTTEAQGHRWFLNKTNKTPSNSFLFTPVTPNEIEHEILSLSNNKSHGLYSSPARLLKCSSKILSNILSKICNMSVSSGTYPSKLKKAKIIPIFKDDDPTAPNNYRPISLLSNFNKIFEKIMYKRMQIFIDDNNILSSSQYGFREAHSTEHAILDIVSTIQTHMDKGLFSCGVFIDLKKAFDTVDHSILLDKLDYYGFRGTMNLWFKSYLSNRSQTTEIDGYVSEESVTAYGVPQGSVLGPLLFLIYINDIQMISNKLKFYLFADDTNLLYADKNLKSLENTINKELRNLSSWLRANKLTLNIKKSHFVLFSPRQKKTSYIPQINILDNESNKFVSLKHKDYVKYLGIIIDKNLSWKLHIDNIANKISRTVGLIAKIRHYLPFLVIRNIYQALISPYLNYGISVWGQASKSYLNKLLLLQKRALRFMFFKQRNAHAIPLFIQAKILPVNFVYHSSVASLMHDISTHSAPPNLLNLFRATSDVHQYDTRSSASKNIYNEKFNLELQRKSFSIYGPKVWNAIPNCLRDMPKQMFKKKFKKILFNILEQQDDYIESPLINEKIKLFV